MIKFFRNIRKKLIEQQKVRNYFLYALGEIFLVVIGILIALQVNNWNEGRKDNNKEVVYLERLDTELEVILERLRTGVDIARKSSEAAESLLLIRKTSVGSNNDEKIPDDIQIRNSIRLLRAGRVPAGSPSAFKEMVSSGELSILKNEALRNALFKYDEFAIIARDVWRAGWNEFLTGYTQIVPVIQAKVDFKKELNETYSIIKIDYKRFFESKDMDAALNIVLGSKVNQYEVLSMQLDLANEIDSLLNAELKKRKSKESINF